MRACWRQSVRSGAGTAFCFVSATRRGWGAYLPKGGSVGKENLEAGAQSPEHQGAEEFQRSLQSDDTVSYGKRLR